MELIYQKSLKLKRLTSGEISNDINEIYSVLDNEIYSVLDNEIYSVLGIEAIHKTLVQE